MLGRQRQRDRGIGSTRSTGRWVQRRFQGERPGNYSVGHRDIAFIRIRHGTFDDERGHESPDEMRIKTKREKMKLSFERGNSREAKALLKGSLEETVR